MKESHISQKRPVGLPPQESATDTSNWDERNISASTLDKITKKRIIREIEFIKGASPTEDTASKALLKSTDRNHIKKTPK